MCVDNLRIVYTPNKRRQIAYFVLQLLIHENEINFKSLQSSASVIFLGFNVMFT